MDHLNHLGKCRDLHHEHQRTLVFDCCNSHRSFRNGRALCATRFVSELDLFVLGMLLYPTRLENTRWSSVIERGQGRSLTNPDCFVCFGSFWTWQTDDIDLVRNGHRFGKTNDSNIILLGVAVVLFMHEDSISDDLLFTIDRLIDVVHTDENKVVAGHDRRAQTMSGCDDVSCINQSATTESTIGLETNLPWLRERERQSEMRGNPFVAYLPMSWQRRELLRRYVVSMVDISVCRIHEERPMRLLSWPWLDSKDECIQWFAQCRLDWHIQDYSCTPKTLARHLSGSIANTIFHFQACSIGIDWRHSWQTPGEALRLITSLLISRMYRSKKEHLVL